MKAALRSKDFWSGILVLLAGVGFLLFAQNLKLGTLRAMGPGFMPTFGSIATILFGLAITWRAVVTADPEQTIELRARPLLTVCAVPLVFMFMIRSAGLVLTVFICTVLVRSAVPAKFDVGSYILAPAILAGFCAILFVRLLGQPVPLWP